MMIISTTGTKHHIAYVKISTDLNLQLLKNFSYSATEINPKIGPTMPFTAMK